MPDSRVNEIGFGPLNGPQRDRSVLPTSHVHTGGGLHVGPSAPTNGDVFWYDTDDTCAFSPYSPTLPITDSFDRADATTLASTSSGTPYIEAGGSWGVQGNLGVTTYTDIAGTKMRVVESLVSDVAVAVTLYRIPAPGKMGLVFRYTDNNNYLVAEQNRLIRVQAGSLTQIALYSQTLIDTDRLTVRLVGSDIKVYRNNILVLDSDSTFNQTATKHGMRYV